jgi:hypothetical protein
MHAPDLDNQPANLHKISGVHRKTAINPAKSMRCGDSLRRTWTQEAIHDQNRPHKIITPSDAQKAKRRVLAAVSKAGQGCLAGDGVTA